MFGYVGGNPVSRVDIMGLEPGESYPTADAAALAAIQDINKTSIKENIEYAGKIYRKWLGFGAYSYTAPNKGTISSSKPGRCPIGTTNEGTYHTHGGYDPNYRSEEFSPDDKSAGDKRNQNEYLGTPSGNVLKYTPIPGNPGAGYVTLIGSGVK